MSHLVRLRFGAALRVGVWRRPSDARRDDWDVDVDDVGLLLEEGGGWSRVLFGRRVGWVPTDWVRTVAP